MAGSVVIESERGTCDGTFHQHNGYFAGDFSRRTGPVPTSFVGTRDLTPAWTTVIPTFDA